MKKTYIAPTVILTKCQLEGFITASNNKGEVINPEGKKDPIQPDSEKPDMKSKWNTGWESDWDTDWED